MEVNKKRLDEQEIKALNVTSWPVWEKEASEFDWYYDSTEEFYVIEGKVEVCYGQNQKIEFAAGDFVTFPAGTTCRWKVIEAIRKYYRFVD